MEWNLWCVRDDIYLKRPVPEGGWWQHGHVAVLPCQENRSIGPLVDWQLYAWWQLFKFSWMEGVAWVSLFAYLLWSHHPTRPYFLNKKMDTKVMMMMMVEAVSVGRLFRWLFCIKFVHIIDVDLIFGEHAISGHAHKHISGTFSRKFWLAILPIIESYALCHSKGLIAHESNLTMQTCLSITQCMISNPFSK